MARRSKIADGHAGSRRMLVKLLALQSQHQLHREQMTELLWPEITPESASNNLNKIIYMASRLRVS
jgi:DNA-binding SARP family transcriptional activator